MGKIEDGSSFGGRDGRMDFVLELVPYYNKLDHFLRSLANQSNHIKAVGKIVGPPVVGEDQILGCTRDTYRENKRRMKKF